MEKEREIAQPYEIPQSSLGSVSTKIAADTYKYKVSERTELRKYRRGALHI
jgi:hypothetical protein